MDRLEQTPLRLGRADPYDSLRLGRRFRRFADLRILRHCLANPVKFGVVSGGGCRTIWRNRSLLAEPTAGESICRPLISFSPQTGQTPLTKDHLRRYRGDAPGHLPVLG